MLAAATINPKIYIAVIFIGMAIYIAYVLLKPSKKTADAQVAEEEEESTELTATPATVISKRIDDNYTGNSKRARHNVAYFATFLVEGEERELLVDRITFERINVGDSSTLVLEGKNFFDFSDGEEISEEELENITSDEEIDPEYTLDSSEEE